MITLLYNKCFKNIGAFKRKKYYQYHDGESDDTKYLIPIAVPPLASHADRLKHV